MAVSWSVWPSDFSTLRQGRQRLVTSLVFGIPEDKCSCAGLLVKIEAMATEKLKNEAAPAMRADVGMDFWVKRENRPRYGGVSFDVTTAGSQNVRRTATCSRVRDAASRACFQTSDIAIEDCGKAAKNPHVGPPHPEQVAIG